MSLRMVCLFAVGWGLASSLAPATAHARAATLHAQRVATPVATLDGVRARLEWEEGATDGYLRIEAARVDAPDLGYRFERVSWECPLRRDGEGGWRCEGRVRAAGRDGARLAVALGPASTDAVLSSGAARLSLDRDAASPDLTGIDLQQVPVAWAQALVEQAWSDARLGRGHVSGHLDVDAGQAAALEVSGRLAIAGLALDTPDGSIAAEGVGGEFGIGLRFGDSMHAAMDGRLHGGEMLFGPAYVSLGERDVDVHVLADRLSNGGWRLDGLRWRDGGVLAGEGALELAPDASLSSLAIDLRSGDLGRLGEAYLSGWLGIAGLSDLRLSGRADTRLEVLDGNLQSADLTLAGAGIDDPQGRFDFRNLRGTLRFSSDATADSALSWDGGALYGLAFGGARMPFSSADGELASPGVELAMLGGAIRFDDVRIRPPGGERGLDIRFGMDLERLDIASLSSALGWPGFTGELSGRIPGARYADDALVFDGGLDVQLFEGRVAVSSLSMERPFGVAPTLSADIAIDGLDLEALTGVLGFGAITGRLHGHVNGLRLVDWEPVAFDAELHSEKTKGVRQRISQRAVQDLSSVGDASFIGSLQGQLIGFFDDFGYARIGISCVLADEVCAMDGLGPVGRGFVVVEGAGIPRLTVVGYNRRVDWPTLVERLAAIGSGDVSPVVD